MLEREIDTISIANFADHLFGRAKEIAWPLTFTQECERDFMNLLEAAVQRIESGGFAEDYSKFAETEKVVEELVKEMRNLAAADVQQLGDDILRRALTKFCPVWPIC